MRPMDFLLDRLQDYITKTDAYRNQDFFEYYPQYKGMFDNIVVQHKEAVT